MKNMRYSLSLKVLLFVFLCLGVTHTTYASTKQSTVIDSINSITLEQATSTLYTLPSGPVAIFAITFSVESFETPITIPTHASRGHAVTLSNIPLQYALFTRQKTITKEGRTAALLVADSGTSTEAFTITPGTRKNYTLYVAHMGVTEDERLRITSIPFKPGTGMKPIILNQSEVSKLETKIVVLDK